MTKLERLATLIAIEAPRRRSRWSPSSRVDWDHIEAIRNELTELGFDWRAMHDDAKRISEERRKIALAKRLGTR